LPRSSGRVAPFRGQAWGPAPTIAQKHPAIALVEHALYQLQSLRYLMRNPMAAETIDEVVLIKGEPLAEMPQDLYIPPEALKVFLETFQGPLDLLLYLIKKENLDILDIRVAEITRQYMEYVELMKNFNLELAAEYLVMAALLTEIKSRLLLPRPTELAIEEEDPRAELIRRLKEYEQIKLAAENLDKLPQIGRDIYQTSIQIPDEEIPKPKPDIEFNDLLQAFLDIIQRAELNKSHLVERDSISVPDRMNQVLQRLKRNQYLEFHQLFKLDEGRLGVVVTFIAILELLKQSLIDITQKELFSPIHVKARTQ
jgi:segregation and condensation protein A